MQQSALPPQALETMCDQLPLDFQVHLAHHAQADNAAAVAQAARDQEPTTATPPPSEPSTNGVFGAAAAAASDKPPSTNGKIRRPPRLAGFDWLGELRRAFGSLSPP
jgi:hypothetical protein